MHLLLLLVGQRFKRYHKDSLKETGNIQTSMTLAGNGSELRFFSDSVEDGNNCSIFL